MRKLILLLLMLCTSVTIQAQTPLLGLSLVAELPYGYDTVQLMNRRAAWSPDSSLLAAVRTVSENLERVELHDASDGSVTASLELDNHVWTLAFNHDSSLLALALGRFGLLVIDVAAWQEVGQVTIAELEEKAAENAFVRNWIQVDPQQIWLQITLIGFTLDSNALLVGDHFNLSLWDISEPDFQSFGEAAEVRSRFFTEDEVYLFMPLTILQEGVWGFVMDHERQEVVYAPLNPDFDGDLVDYAAAVEIAGMSGVYFEASDDGTRLLTADFGGLELLDTPNGQVTQINYQEARFPLSDLMRMTLNQDGTLMVSVHQGRMRLWDIETISELAAIPFDGQFIRDVLISPDGGKILFVWPDKMELWSLSRT